MDCIKAVGVFLYLKFRREILLCVRDIVVRVVLPGRHSAADPMQLSWLTLSSVRYALLAKREFLYLRHAVLRVRCDLRLKKQLSIEN